LSFISALSEWMPEHNNCHCPNELERSTKPCLSMRCSPMLVIVAVELRAVRRWDLSFWFTVKPMMTGILYLCLVMPSLTDAISNTVYTYGGSSSCYHFCPKPPSSTIFFVLFVVAPCVSLRCIPLRLCSCASTYKVSDYMKAGIKTSRANPMQYKRGHTDIIPPTASRKCHASK
jgi:hypothetical protein